VQRSDSIRFRVGLRQSVVGQKSGGISCAAQAFRFARSSVFRLGATLPDVKAYEARRAIFNGAREVDMVINIGALEIRRRLHGRRRHSRRAEAAHENGVLLKVIIETALLTDEEKVRACLASKNAGADFVKTSTGFAKGGATVDDVADAANVVGEAAILGVKASGGVKGIEDAKKRCSKPAQPESARRSASKSRRKRAASNRISSQEVIIKFVRINTP
jgi:deoxyribose-phosphate aldolase